jgi:branched-chain amino acid transport system permease protein
MKLFLQLLANGLVNGALFAMLAVGFGLVWRTIRVFHIAYGALYVVCAYCFQTLVVRGGMSPFPGLLLTLLLAALAGVLVEVGFYRPFFRRRASPGAVLVASLGLFVATENIIALIFGNELQTMQRGIESAFRLGPLLLTRLQAIEFGVGTFVVTTLWLLVRRLRIFKALWAMGDQPELISVLGLPLFQLRALVFVISTVLVAIPASLTTLDVGIDPHMGMSNLLIAAVAVLVGGINSYPGWVAGAGLLALLQSLVVWRFSARWMDLVTFGLLVLILVFRPDGLLAQHRRMEEK